MSRETWIQILVGGTLVPLIGFLSISVSNLKSTLSQIDGKINTVNAQVTSTSQRVERIAQALPGLAVRIARDELAKPVSTAVLCMKPRSDDNGQWTAAVHVIDTGSLLRTVFDMKLDSPEDREVSWKLRGAAADCEISNCSFEQVCGWSSETNVPCTLPPALDVTSSFILYNTSATTFINILGVTENKTFYPLEASITDFSSLITEIGTRKLTDYITVDILTSTQSTTQPRE